MIAPSVEEARPFYQSAQNHAEEAEFLFNAGRGTGAIYLAGFSVDCMLKALILSTVPPDERSLMLASFRGDRAHDYDRLKAKYFDSGGCPFPSVVSKYLSLIDTWATDLRYEPVTTKQEDAASFLKAAREIVTWVCGEL